MQERQRLIQLIRFNGLSVSAAARECGVTRATAYKWLRREQEMGMQSLSEFSRRPHRLRPGVDEAIVEQVLALKRSYPARGAKKLHAMLWPPRQPGQTGAVAQPLVSVRSIDRILNRAGLTGPAAAPRQQWQRFERSACNELWQIDFKGLQKRHGYRPLTLLDDCSRFLLALEPVSNGETDSVWSVLWRAFGECGLPECLLSDNGDGFNSVQGLGPTPLQARLWRLGIHTTHGRVRHPQTQGKVERVHRTFEVEWSQELRPGSLENAEVTLRQIRHAYNWERPHEALGQLVPGVVYSRSCRKRPDTLPPALVSAAGLARKVDEFGKFSFHGRRYLAGRGLAKETIEVREEEQGYVLFYANHRVQTLDKICVD